MKFIDEKLLQRLQMNARESVSALSRALNVSRATVQEHIKTLERRDVIRGYTVVLGQGHQSRHVAAQVMIAVEANQSAFVVNRLKKFRELDSLYSISGQYDLLAQIGCDKTETLDAVLDTIAAVPGVHKTLSSILLSDKLANTV